jgi:hypothetical protein
MEDLSFLIAGFNNGKVVAVAIEFADIRDNPNLAISCFNCYRHKS